MTWLTRLSLRNRTLVALAAVLIGVFGVQATTSLKQELIPSLQIPVAAVVSPFAGATPAVVEQQVTAPLEAAVKGVSGVTGTESTSSGGMSVVLVEMEYGTDLTAVQRDLQQAVTGVTGLPDGVEPTVVAGSTDEIPVVQLAASSSMADAELTKTLRERVVPLLEDVDDVNEVSLSGVGDRVVTINLDPTALVTRGVSPLTVADALRANGVRVPAGTVGSGERELSVQVGAPITTVEELRDLYVPSAVPGQAPVRLGDLAQVDSEFAPATGYSRTDGRSSVGIGVTKTSDGNAVTISHEVQELVPQIEELLGPGAKVTVVFDQAPYIEQSIEDLTTEGLLGLTFAVLVILAFLLSVRSTLVTAISIPLSLLIALICLSVNGYSLNILTLGALTIAVGRVVDDSIVVIENIKRHLSQGEPTRQAVLGAVREVASAITASTITTVAVFLPIGLVGGEVGELFRPFALTVTAALLGSLLVSLTIVPVLAAWLLRPRASRAGAHAADGDRAEPVEEGARLQRGYLPVLRGALAHPVLTCGLAVLVLVGTFALVPQLKTNFLSDSGQNTFQISQELPPGTALVSTDNAAKKVEQILADTPGVQSYQTVVGSLGGSSHMALAGGGLASNTATHLVTTDADLDQTALRDELRERFDALPDVGSVIIESGGGPGSGTLEVVVRAEDPQVLEQAANQVEQAVRSMPDAVDVRNNLADRQPTVEVAVNRRAAAAAGLSDQQIGQTVATALRGAPVGALTIDGVQQTVMMRTGTGPGDVAALRGLPIGPVTLGEVADVREVDQAASITRIDGSRSASITATPNQDDLGAVTRDLQQRLDELDLPAGASAEIGGVSADQDEAFGQLGTALALAVAIVYLVMVATFRSLVQPLLLLVSIPFAATGALGLLLITDTPLGVPALIGMLMLIGIVVTNAIVLIDLVNQYRSAGASVRDAVIDGARRRLRPILMTAVATICALFPLSLGLSGGGLFISQPLAVVVIGGLISSTLLTLVLVPVLYSLVERARERLRGGPALASGAGLGEPALAAATATAGTTTGAATAGVATADVPAAGEAAEASPVTAAARSWRPSRSANSVRSAHSPGPARHPVRNGTEPPAGPAGPARGTRHGDPSGVVTGVVTGPDRSPLADAVVSLVGAQGEQIGYTTSAADGSYRLPAPATGRYLLVCQATDGNQETVANWISMDATSGSAVHHDVVLGEAPTPRT